MSALIVAFPVFMWVSSLNSRTERADPTVRTSPVRRWLTYLTLFGAACTLIGDVMSLVYSVLGGELTTRFVLKVLIVGAIARDDLLVLPDGPARRREGREGMTPAARGRVAGAVATVAVVGAVAAGVYLLRSPSEERTLRLDERRVSDLMALADAVDVFWTRHQRLPASLEELRSEPVGRLDLNDPGTGNPHEHRPLAPRSYEVCAAFERDSAARDRLPRRRVVVTPPRAPVLHAGAADAGEVIASAAVFGPVGPDARGADMSSAAGSHVASTPIRPASWFYAVLVALGGTLAVVFWFVAATPYFSLQRESFGPAPDIYWPRRFPLLTHIAGGSIALLLGPINLWLGETRRRLPWHKNLGFGYMAGVLVGAAWALYLAVTTPVGWMFGSGLFALGVAWTVTTGMAFRAIKNRAIVQHREWMIRSYVVTLGFVFFRILVALTEVMGVGTGTERLSVAAWFAWAVPLMLTEPILQWRKAKA